MDLHLEGKTALVTGASAGIGRAIAKGLAAEGVKLCISARRRELLEEVADEIVAAGGKQPHIAIVDIMEEGAPQKLAQEALSKLREVNILINCVGGGKDPMSLESAEEKWVEAMTFNYLRARQLTLAIVPDMIRHKWGRIINLTGKSEVSRLSGTNPAKAAVHAFSKGLSRELGKHRITVNCIAPGKIMSEQIHRNYTVEFREKQSTNDIPLGRYGEPEELACLAVFLVSPLAGYITGTVMPVDGGLRRYAF